MSAVNLNDGATTIHSLLQFHDRESFEYQRDHGKFAKLLSKANCTTLVIDEVSRLQAYQLDGIRKLPTKPTFKLCSPATSANCRRINYHKANGHDTKKLEGRIKKHLTPFFTGKKTHRCVESSAYIAARSRTMPSRNDQ